ncbi:MAG: hypothetical protein EAZ97_08095 [Bacteroidetes bacterium]|nr:MAG: hypothetical protein EAZ97_08095 [Bacteroidota bacterium]
MKKQAFESWEYSQINEEFGYKRHFKNFPLIEEWLKAEEDINAEEKTILLRLCDRLLLNTEAWNEDELKMFFIAPLLETVNFYSPDYKIFTQRKFSATIGDWLLNGVFDLIVSKGEQHPKKPYFFLHEYKQERKKENDPLGQLLAAMIVAQSKNEKDIILYGSYIMGRYYYFVILKGKEYGVSNSLNAADIDDLFKIFSMMRWVRQKIDLMVQEEQKS